MNLKALSAAAAVLLGAGLVASCGGGGGYSSPTTSTPPPSSANTMSIAIVGVNGSQSFAPNPAGVKVGQSVVWHNSDGVTHHIVQDTAGGQVGGGTGGIYGPDNPAGGGGFDAGSTSPGANSSTLPVKEAAVIHYHCAIHPSMVGTLTVTN